MFIKRDSASINLLYLDTEKAQALVQFQKDGQVYLYSDVSQESIRSIVENPEESLGAWVNENLVHLDKQIAPKNLTEKFIQHFAK